MYMHMHMHVHVHVSVYVYVIQLCAVITVQYNMSHTTALPDAEHKSDLTFTKDTPYLALTVELRSVSCEDLGENWPRYNGTALYMRIHGVHLPIFLRIVSFLPSTLGTLLELSLWMNDLQYPFADQNGRRSCKGNYLSVMDYYNMVNKCGL